MIRHMRSDADALLDMVEELNTVAELELLDEDPEWKLPYTVMDDLDPMNAFIGTRDQMR
ncbi:uncharacterized protein V6R79_019662 [Siganus canaliculatus]